MTKSDYVHERPTEGWIDLYRSHCTHRKTVHCTAFVKLLAELDYHRETLRIVNDLGATRYGLNGAAMARLALRKRHPELQEEK